MLVEPPEKEVRLEKAPLPSNKWDYQTFKEYLLAQARGREFLLPLNEFPREIEFFEDWHRTFNRMRDATEQDDIERVALVGYRLKQRAIYLPNEHVVARTARKFERGGYRPVDPILTLIQQLSSFAEGLDDSIGILHSHPIEKVFGLRLFGGRLSAGDLHIVLRSACGSMIGVADGRVNSIAFKTRESVVPGDPQDKFYDLWEKEPQPQKLDELLAQKYNIALYKGAINGVLKRV
ncbi:hypothetical protein A2697_02575 [Candidatus Curtissbacteria bacterium RIFCSPHIGHO2_01_FULL_41_44]|uniref:Uncharacterized protein n=1 Tax=Candidatus Curtissbacteria bacterium RIFCSPLOWO2_01_FULL_42_50 TaxID=1797730 RepID=A0A1F5H2F0_9BACT|nr:MAG: hypothetical protein A2697_02575 [Candidatus Curtissbacteria bacterium RIFCSPHIGHO2_01_FULL_41_44]OGD96580.1 MAG: hypothetical protein A3E71_02740 [Candidatus Curtissbacteria bacterium RIFCSPHIGHO2_12_FULL_42_33]OGD98281.1 MAG: hypothetical protein A3B54_04180 [Candidatus Curtissbacteria bacterium RIFCSPLOWO2_01_FULL_42_50]OGE03456.1 MAG: hypothetical protein A3G16_02535 [Candidatus Curtissbacteria bacterium RIFCSPLOWO2_12_FULL_41_16]OGE10353.1 MAG: hypothetical protein A3H87_02100 [Can